jgi:hypothetical protein
MEMLKSQPFNLRGLALFLCGIVIDGKKMEKDCA